MKKTILSIILTATIAASMITLPTQAGTIDQVKAKVQAIKNDTNTLKSKSNSIQTRVEEVSYSVNAQIAETIDIRSLLEPLELIHQMKAKFAGGGFDPAELLDIIDTEELQDRINELKLERAENEAAMNDPNLEAFRSEFIETLEGMNKIGSRGTGVRPPSPLQTLVGNAPIKLLAMLKMAVEDGTLEELRDTALRATSFIEEHKKYFEAAKAAKESGKTVFDFVKEYYCSKGEKARRVKLFANIDQVERLNIMITKMDMLKLKFGEKLDKTSAIQLHGYVGVEINMGKRTNKTIEHYTTKFRVERDKTRSKIKKLNFIILNKECGKNVDSDI